MRLWGAKSRWTSCDRVVNERISRLTAIDVRIGVSISSTEGGAGRHSPSQCRPQRILVRSASARSLRLALSQVEERTGAKGPAEAADAQPGAAAPEAGSLPGGDSVRRHRA